MRIELQPGESLPDYAFRVTAERDHARAEIELWRSRTVSEPATLTLMRVEHERDEAQRQLAELKRGLVNNNSDFQLAFLDAYLDHFKALRTEVGTQKFRADGADDDLKDAIALLKACRPYVETMSLPPLFSLDKTWVGARGVLARLDAVLKGEHQ